MFKPLPAVLALAATAATAQTPAPNADILAAAAAFDAAQQRGDRATLERMLAPDFLIVHGSGKVGGRDEFVAGFTAAGSRLDPFVVTDRLFVRAAPDVAIVGGEARITGVEGGRRIAEHFRYADTFARRDGRWVVVYAQITALGR